MGFESRRSGIVSDSRLWLLGILSVPFMSSVALAQEEDEEEVVDEIITVGTQIRGASISDALSVSVISQADIEDLGIDSGDELLEFMAEQGQNFFAESENVSGGVNSARGDVGAFNLRNLGTGNTLVLLNGRRMVNAANYQTEAVGGSFIPVNTVNAQSLPVSGLQRVEVLRDGASAIYGADAVAGVVNYVMKTDFEGLRVSAKFADWEGLPRNDTRLTVEWGKNFNGGATNLSIFASVYDRDRVNSQDDPKWADDDFRRFITDENDPFFGDTSFRRSSANSGFGQFDVISSVASLGLTGTIWDSAGEFQLLPAGDADCEFGINANVCGQVDGPAITRYNLNSNRDLLSELRRIHVFAFLNHDFGNGLESFTEVSAYLSDTNTLRQASTRLSAVSNYRVGAENYYNPFGVCGSPNRLPFDVIGDDTNGGVPCAGLELRIDNYRWAEVPRIVNNDGETFRIQQGLRGELGSWDWDTAFTWSRATKEDVTSNRISNTIIQQLLNDPTPSAYNPFAGAIDPMETNIGPALIDVRRDSETELTMLDFKISRGDLFELPAGPVGIVAGVEFREVSFDDDRDPRLDGTTRFVDNAGNTFPLISDVMNSSPSADSSGSRDVTSLFSELQLPVLDNLDVQLALRYEDFSDIGDTTVGKIAAGWRPFERLLLRGSWSEGFRVPNLVTVNEGDVARSNTRDDFYCLQADPDEVELDCAYGIQRTAGGSQNLVPEESTNTSIGIVIDPTDSLTFTFDYWTIEKEGTIGLFGEENWIALDLLTRLEQGTGNCASVVGAPQVLREDPSTLDPTEAAIYTDAGLCPVGQVQRIDDTYANLGARELEGFDVGIYYTLDTRIGEFDFRYVASFLEKYDQLPSVEAQVLLDAQAAGTLPDSVPVVGFSDLIRIDGNPEQKQTLRVRWSKGDWGASLSGRYLSDVIETRPGLGSDGSEWVLDSMTTFNASVDYRFEAFGETDARVRFGIVNLFDERAPLASERFGYESDVHNDMPRNFYLDVRLDF